MVNLLGRRDGGSEVDYTVNPQIGFPGDHRPGDSALPSNHVFPAWDAIAGNMIATALLAALRHRDRHGVGQLVTLALKDVGLAMLGHLGMIAEVQVNDVDRAALRQPPVRRLRLRFRTPATAAARWWSG